MELMRKVLNEMKIGQKIEINGLVLTKTGKYKFESNEHEYSTIEVVVNFSDFEFNVLN